MIKMNSKEILSFCLNKGILLDKELLNLFSETEDVDSVKLFIEKVGLHTKKKFLTKEVFSESKENIDFLFSDLPSERKKSVEKLKIKLGLNIEISKEVEEVVSVPKQSFLEEDNSVRIVSMAPPSSKKLEVKDFVKYFRNRFESMRNILQEHSELDNLVSIDKLSNNNQSVAVIGMVSSKTITKNKNIIFEIEDLTGKLKVLITQNKKDLYEKAEEISLDSIIGFKGSGSKEIFFVNDVVFPESLLPERKKSPFEEYALFIADLHFGSNRFMEKNFLKFLDYLNGKVPNTPEVNKIKYLFIVGDIVTGVGNYPDQEKDLVIDNLEDQFSKLAELLGKLRSDIKIIISPGNHDGVRIMEPQPVIDEKYAWPLYNLKNVFLTTNPAIVNIGAKSGFSGFNVLTYHGFSFPYYANNVPSLIKKNAMNCPENIMKYLLLNRHLAPSHASAQYFPLEKDNLLIKGIPDIFVAGHTHKCAVSYYNNILVISASCWEEMTPYQEKFGNIPDHCKVPMVNLKTRAVKILDFE